MKRFQVELSHRTGAAPWQGTHVFTVKPDSTFGFYANAPIFGCSKTYRTERDAIACMAADHACDVVSVVEMVEADEDFPNETFVPIADLDAWAEFYAANKDALDEIGDEATCRAIACSGGLIIGGGAAPLFRVAFVDKT